MDFSHDTKNFTIDNKNYTMRRYTLGLIARIQAENSTVLEIDILKECTNMQDEAINKIDNQQLTNIVNAVFDYTNSLGDGDGSKKP